MNNKIKKLHNINGAFFYEKIKKYYEKIAMANFKFN